MEVRDQNGEGRWSADQIVGRYRRWAAKLGVSQPRDLSPRVYESGGVSWVAPVMERVIEGIEAQDVACAQIGVEFMEEDQGFVFGAILKSNAARALRRFQHLTDEQIDRIRRRVATMYATGIVPREFAQYLRLIRRVGPGSYWAQIVDAEPKNYLAKRAKRYFMAGFDRDGRPTAS